MILKSPWWVRLKVRDTTEPLSTQHKYSPPSFSHHQYLASSKTISKKKFMGRKILFYLSIPQYFSFLEYFKADSRQQVISAIIFHSHWSEFSLTLHPGLQTLWECHQDCRHLPWAMGFPWSRPTGREGLMSWSPPTRVLFPLRPLFVMMV